MKLRLLQQNFRNPLKSLQTVVQNFWKSLQFRIIGLAHRPFLVCFVSISYTRPKDFDRSSIKSRCCWFSIFCFVSFSCAWPYNFNRCSSFLVFCTVFIYPALRFWWILMDFQFLLVIVFVNPGPTILIDFHVFLFFVTFSYIQHYDFDEFWWVSNFVCFASFSFC